MATRQPSQLDLLIAAWAQLRTAINVTLPSLAARAQAAKGRLASGGGIGRKVQ